MTAIDPYASLAGLARGWRTQARDLIARAAALENRTDVDSPEGDRRLRPPRGELVSAARTNRTTARALESAARQLEDAIEFARTHVHPSCGNLS